MREIRQRVPLRGVDWADPEFPELDRLRRKKRNAKKQKRDKRRYEGGRNLAMPRAKERGIFPRRTYGANTSAGLARRSMADGDNGLPSTLESAPIPGPGDPESPPGDTAFS